MIFIGDTHGHFKTYKYLVKGFDCSLQVGDFGLFEESQLFDINMEHKFIRGNHDNPDVVVKSPNYLGDYGFKNDIFYLGGGQSIDRYCPNHIHLALTEEDPPVNCFEISKKKAERMGLHTFQYCREEGKTWWRNEQLSEEDLISAIELYCRIKPNIVVTHECPYRFSNYLGELKFLNVVSKYPPLEPLWL